MSPAFVPRKKGEKLPPLSERLAKIGLSRDWDFILHLPLRYEDETHIVAISKLDLGQAQQCEGQVLECHIVSRGQQQQLQASISDGSATLHIRFLHFYPSQQKQLAVGKKVRLYGTVRQGYFGLEMVHPKVKVPLDGSSLPTTLTPIYPAGESITQPWLRKRISRALLDIEIKELLPEELLEQLHLPHLADALKRLHHPPLGASMQALSDRTDIAWQRLKFDELLAQQIALRHSRDLKSNNVAHPITSDCSDLYDKLLQSLPFSLTDAQNRVLAEICDDLNRSIPMNRLVQGDVGSGKTVVAALAAAAAIDAGFQAALMAPTEILAEQHFQKIACWLEPLGVTTAWLSGKQKVKDRRNNLELIQTGKAQLIIGTHALIQDGVRFHKLGLAIVDEQHRFGVEQRLALRNSNDSYLPHLLMLSATPIPRTLAMSYLADLDVSVIDQLPPGRKPIHTRLISLHRKNEVIASIDQQIQLGRQVYWVCPLIEESDKLDLTAATETYEQIVQQLPHRRVGLVHGALNNEVKQQEMDRFKNGQIDILVATTVIEVGVDVPNATLMIIEHAERFGLAQLHQLRGRVGRGAEQSFCLLLYGELSETGQERLKVIRETTDGFEVARRDLEIRGPGEFLGVRQSGTPMLRFANLEDDTLLLETARDFAVKWLQKDPQTALKHAQRWFNGKEYFLEA